MCLKDLQGIITFTEGQIGFTVSISCLRLDVQ